MYKFLILSFVITSCVSYDYQTRLSSPIKSEVSRLDNARYSIELKIMKQAVAITIVNKGKSAISIPWDSVAIIDDTKRSRRVIHTGVRLIDRDKPQSPSVIAPASELYDEITPIDNIELSGTSWITYPLIEGDQKTHIGKSIGVFLPLEISGKREELNFSLEILGVLERK